MPLTLHPEIEDVNTRVMYESDCNKVKFKFLGNMVIGCDRSKAFVMMDLYNSLKDDMHRDLVQYGGAFMMVIDA